MEKKINLIVKESVKNVRVDVFISNNENDLSRSRIKNLILGKKLKINNKIENFRNELNQLDEHLNNSDREKTFYESSLKEKVDILNKLQKSNKKPLRGIYLKIKSSVATSYFRSEVGAKQVLKYNGPSIVLGDYKGCIPFEEVGKTWAI